MACNSKLKTLVSRGRQKNALSGHFNLQNMDRLDPF